MNKRELEKCKILLNEAIRNGQLSRDEFSKAEKLKENSTEHEILMLKAQNHLGYAEGINHSLVSLGYKDERIAELKNIL